MFNTFNININTVLSLDTAGSFAKFAYIDDWIQLDIYINPAFPIGWFLSITWGPKLPCQGILILNIDKSTAIN